MSQEYVKTKQNTFFTKQVFKTNTQNKETDFDQVALYF